MIICKTHQYKIAFIDNDVDEEKDREIAYVICDRCGDVQKKKVGNNYTPAL